MTATPSRQVYRPAPQGAATVSRPQEEVLTPPSATRTVGGLLVGLFAVLLAFAALPLALSQPVVAVLLLLLGVAVLLALFLWRPDPEVEDAADPVGVVARRDRWLD